MLKTTCRPLAFDSLEGKVLLSAATAQPAKAAHHHPAERFLLNGSLLGLPNGKPGVDGFTETSFPVTGRLASLGAVHGAFSLQDTFIPIGTKPNFSGASLTLENSKGSVQLSITQPKKHQYEFTIVSGTQAYTSESGSGTMVILSPRSSLDFVMTLHTQVAKKG